MARGAAEKELDVAALGRALWRRKSWIAVPTAIAGFASIAAVNLVTPTYRSESRVLIEGRENVFLRPEADKNGERVAVDQEAVQSQVQVVLSRDLASHVIKQLKLNERPEFDPVLRGFSPIQNVAILLGLSRDPITMTPEERVLESFYKKITAYPVDKSRVVAIEFESTDPLLAAQAANTIAATYLTLQQGAKQDQTRAAGVWLSGEIETMRAKVLEAEARVEEYRARSNLFVGTNNTTLSNQQLGELNTQISLAQTQRAEAETRATMIRDLLKRGPVEVSDVLNSELIRRLSEQRATLRAQLAEQSSTLLDQHPRIKELRAQISDLDRQMRNEGGKLARSFENDARMVATRVEHLSASLEQLKRRAASSNEQDVQLRALDREAKAQRELLESYLSKYREAIARDSMGATQGDARIISQATISTTPASPKKVPIVILATLATFLVSMGVVVGVELLSSGALMAAPSTDEGRIRREQPDLQRRGEPPAPSRREAEWELALAAIAADLKSEGKSLAIVAAQKDAGARALALSLGRSLAPKKRTVLVDASLEQNEASPNPLPGLAEFVLGAGSFASMIGRDGASRLHWIGPGSKPCDDVALWSSERMAMAMDALARTYDIVLVNAGVLSAQAAPRLARFASKALLFAHGAPQDVATVARERLIAAGFTDVSVFSLPFPEVNAPESSGRAAA